MNDLTLKDIAEYFRKKYPKATGVTLWVGHYEFNVSIANRFYTTDYSIRTLDGEWLKEEGVSGEQ